MEIAQVVVYFALHSVAHERGEPYLAMSGSHKRHCGCKVRAAFDDIPQHFLH